MTRSLSLILILALLPSALAACGGDDTDEQTAVREAVVGYLDALQGRDADAVCSKLTDAEIRDLEVSSSCREVYAEAFTLLDENGVELPAYEIEDVSIDGDRAEVRLVSEATDVSVPLAREGGAWKLAGTTSLAGFHPDDPIPGEPGG